MHASRSQKVAEVGAGLSWVWGRNAPRPGTSCGPAVSQAPRVDTKNQVTLTQGSRQGGGKAPLSHPALTQVQGRSLGRGAPSPKPRASRPLTCTPAKLCRPRYYPARDRPAPSGSLQPLWPGAL